MLDFSNITKKYTNNNIENLVLSNASIRISNSEINLITGNSGVGKSTLLNIMGCLIKPDKGKVSMHGVSHDLSNDNLSKFRIQLFSYLFQDFNLLPEFNVYENLMIPSYINKLNLKKTKLNIDKYMKYVDLDHLKLAYPSTLSHGEKQRVAMLRSLLGGKKIILADEPTGNLDEINTKLLLELIVNINKELGYTFVITSHDTSFKNISNNIFKIYNKKIDKIK
ncbi:MAG: lipoprotein-releasing system ATP-binding protein LolD [Candidatus Marinimicrobia bacterium]|nr:lipoprotein-releasing system ATP-binding protein LolD [Candidatus Neomarinimicrobiota bacterium]